MSPLAALTVSLPPAPFTVLYDPATGSVRSGAFGDMAAAVGRLAPGVEVDPTVRPGEVAGPIRAALESYAAGDVRAVEQVAVEQPGGPFMHRAWSAMRRIDPGRTLTYTELAAAAGNPKAVRAAGSACATNAVALIIPCHRIVRTDGSLGGYQYGLTVKRWLLEHEAAHSSAG